MMYIALGVGAELHPASVRTFKKSIVVNPEIEVRDSEPNSG